MPIIQKIKKSLDISGRINYRARALPTAIMTKLMEWVTVAVLLVSIWAAFFFEIVFPEWSHRNKMQVIGMPFVGVGLIALYSVSVIGYRVSNFNDCEDAATELREEINEAKADLAKKGLKVE